MTQPKVLLVDDETDMRWVLEGVFRDAGFQVEQAADGAQAMARLREAPPDVVVSDVRMPGFDGLTLLEQVHRQQGDLPVILLTAVDAIDTAVEAMKLGAYDFLQKPFDRDRLVRTARRAAEQRMLQLEVARLRGSTASLDFGRSPGAKEIARLVRLVASQDRVSVLLCGESGTGKEVVARAIHAHSSRHAGPFVAVDCGALPEPLMESQLFGHKKGAFTGADQDRPGLFRMADRGTLFLDELGNLPLALQSKLLRALQERSVVPVGGGDPLPFDARLVAATNTDLQAEVQAQRFRIDLYHRVAEFVLPIPPLRERKDDVLPLAQRFLAEACADMGKPVRGFTPAAQQLLHAHSWPGNLREVRNAVRRALVVCAGPELDAADFALGPAAATHAPRDAEAAELPLAEQVRRASDGLEAEILREALRRHDGNKAAAARALQIDYTTLHRKLKKHGIG
jgi:DNA-binding NtrC family response regulator